MSFCDYQPKLNIERVFGQRRSQVFLPMGDRSTNHNSFAKAIATVAKENAISLFFLPELGDHINLRMTVLARDSLCYEKIQSHNTN
jgi:hypothetical protein